MRLLHTSDWHLGKQLMERSLLEDQAFALDALLDLLAADPHDLLVVAGDVYDQAIPPEAAVELLGRFLARLRERLPGLPVVLTAGNHDSGARLASNAELVRLAGVHLRGDVDAVARPISFETAGGEPVDVWAVPFLWPGALEREGAIASTQVEALDWALERIHGRLDGSRTNVLVAHCFTRNGTASDSERVLVGQATQVGAELFGAFDYVALGHLHRSQQVAGNARYSGSLLPYSFAEADDVKVVLSVEVTAGSAPAITARPLPRRRALRRLTGTLRELLEAPVYDAFVDDYLQLTLSQPELAGQPMAALRRRFPNVLQLVNPVAGLAAGRSAKTHGCEPGRDLTADFLAFERALAGGEVDPEVRAAFERLRDGLDAAPPSGGAA